MAVSHRGAISFGLVHIPVGLYTAIQDNDIHFNQLCKENGDRVRYKKVCAGCGKEVQNKDIGKGFEYEKDKYIIINDEDFEKAKSEKDKSIHILHFTDVNSIKPIYFDKTYYAIPENGGEKAFELLRKSMLDENKVAVAKTVMGIKEKLLTIIPTQEGLILETMFYQDEIKDVPKDIKNVESKEDEINMAKILIKAMVKDFNPSEYKDEYRDKLWEIINQKINGQQVTAPDEKIEVNVIDIMEALKQSVERVKK